MPANYKPQSDFQRFVIDATFAIRGQARQRKESISKLIDISFELSDHLGYLFCAPEAREVNHWIKEVAAWLEKARQLLSIKNGKLPELDFLEHLYEGPAGEPRDKEDLMRRVNRHLKPHEITRSVSDPRFAQGYVALLREVYLSKEVSSNAVRASLQKQGWIL